MGAPARSETPTVGEARRGAADDFGQEPQWQADLPDAGSALNGRSSQCRISCINEL